MLESCQRALHQPRKLSPCKKSPALRCERSRRSSSILSLVAALPRADTTGGKRRGTRYPTVRCILAGLMTNQPAIMSSPICEVWDGK